MLGIFFKTQTVKPNFTVPVSAIFFGQGGERGNGAGQQSIIHG